MTVNDLYRYLDSKIPQSLSMDWDNDGLMCAPNPAKEVKRVLIALDVTSSVVSYAVAHRYDVIVSHHPMVFHDLKHLDGNRLQEAKLMQCVKEDISVMSFHTRLDVLTGGVNDVLAKRLGLKDTVPFESEGVLIGRIGYLPKAMPLDTFAKTVKDALGCPVVSLADAGKEVKKVALVGGEGSDCLEDALKAGADTYVSGELKYHHLVDAPEMGINCVVAGHYYTETGVCAFLKDLIGSFCSGLEIDVLESNEIRVV